MSQWSHDPSPAESTPQATSIPYAVPVRPQLQHDRRSGLIAFGIASILIGALAALLAAFTSVVVMMMMTQVGKGPVVADVPRRPRLRRRRHILYLGGNRIDPV
jgi:uncharacterized SAM-binding protein YcdF (DUF218 family)